MVGYILYFILIRLLDPLISFDWLVRFHTFVIGWLILYLIGKSKGRMGAGQHLPLSQIFLYPKSSFIPNPKSPKMPSGFRPRSPHPEITKQGSVLHAAQPTCVSELHHIHDQP